MPIEITFDQLPTGYVENTGRAGDKMIFSLSGFFSSEDGDDLVKRLEGFPQDIVNRIPPSYAVLPSMINSLLALIRRDKTATLYLNEVRPIMHTRIKGGCKKGNRISADQILDIGKITFEGIQIPNDVGIVYFFTAGWRRGFFYDLAPLYGEDIQLRSFDVEELIGSLYSYLFFQERFKITSDEWDFFFHQRWFPFSYIKKSILKKMILHAKNNWNIDDLLPEISENVKQVLTSSNPINLSSPYFTEHADLLKTAIERYLADDHVSCTSILYPRIEGLMRTFHRTEGKAGSFGSKNLTKVVVEHQEDSRIAYSLLLPSKFKDYLNEVYFANFAPGSAPDVGRHAISHGEASSKDFNLKSSTIGFLIIFQLTLFFSDGTKSESK